MIPDIVTPIQGAYVSAPVSRREDDEARRLRVASVNPSQEGQKAGADAAKSQTYAANQRAADSTRFTDPKTSENLVLPQLQEKVTDKKNSFQQNSTTDPNDIDREQNQKLNVDLQKKLTIGDGGDANPVLQKLDSAREEFKSQQVEEQARREQVKEQELDKIRRDSDRKEAFRNEFLNEARSKEARKEEFEKEAREFQQRQDKLRELFINQSDLAFIGQRANLFA